MKALLITAIAFLALLTTSWMENKSESKDTELQAIFPKGEKGPAENFTGNAGATSLVANDSTYNTLVGNVYFEPGAGATGNSSSRTDTINYRRCRLTSN